MGTLENLPKKYGQTPINTISLTEIERKALLLLYTPKRAAGAMAFLAHAHDRDGYPAMLATL